jgi:hypothetical protein
MKQWKQVPDMYMWKNINTGEVISVAGGKEKGWFVVRRTSQVPLNGSYYDYESAEISPYYILPTPPIGMQGTLSKRSVQENEKWQPGTFDDAINYAYNYMTKQKK